MFPNILLGTELDHEWVCVVRREVESQVPDEDVGGKLDDHQLVEQAHPLPHQTRGEADIGKPGHFFWSSLTGLCYELFFLYLPTEHHGSLKEMPVGWPQSPQALEVETIFLVILLVTE